MVSAYAFLLGSSGFYEKAFLSLDLLFCFEPRKCLTSRFVVQVLELGYRLTLPLRDRSSLDVTLHDKAKDKARQYKTRQDKTRQDKTRPKQDKTSARSRLRPDKVMNALVGKANPGARRTTFKQDKKSTLAALSGGEKGCPVLS